MFLFIALATCYEITEPSETNYSIPAGYYKMTLKGGQGGNACHAGKEVKDHVGGKGAIISGIVHLKGLNEYRMVVGGSPPANCAERINYGSQFGEGGNSGEDTELQNGTDTGGGGGGYSLFEIKDGSLIAIAGGGSGASAFTNGASAGGRNQNYRITSQSGDEDICDTKKYNCFTDSKRGGDGEYSASYPGSGGGGGARGGYGNSWAYYDSSVWQSVAKGGSSDWNDTYFIEEPNISVGIFNGAEGNGLFTLEPLTKCNSSCYDCEYGNANICTECFPGNVSFEGSCFNSCADTSTPTYRNGDRCERCIEGCSKCNDGKTCEECLPGYELNNQKCIPQQTPQATPSNTPSTTPQMAPSSTPQTTPSNTPSTTPQMTPSSTPQTTPSNTPSNTPSVTPSTTPSDTPLITPETTPATTPSTTPQETPHDTSSMTPEIIDGEDPDDGKNDNKPDENPTQTPDSKHVDGLGGGTTNGNEGENKFPLGLIIGIIVGVLALIGIIAFAIYYCTRSHEENDSFEEEMNEETIMSTTEFNSVTLDNPMFTTSITHDTEDVFKDDFEEKYTSEIFHLHDEEL